MTLLSRNVLVSLVDLVLCNSSLLIIFVGLNELTLLFLQGGHLTLELSISCLEVLDVLKVLVDEANGEEYADSYKNAENSEQDHLDSDLLSKCGECHAGKDAYKHYFSP